MRNLCALSSRFWLLPLLALLCFSGTASATLVSRAGGQAYYDDVLNITWLTDANYAHASGYVYTVTPHVPGHDPEYEAALTFQSDPTRETAEEFIDFLNTNLHLGTSGWRMPVVSVPDPTCSVSTGNAHGYGCTASEMGSLFYTTLGNTEGLPPSNTGPFANVWSGLYWTTTAYPPNPNYLYDFHWGNGAQGANNGESFGAAYIWAVHDGDIAAIPEPTSGLLLALGLGGLALRRRRAADRGCHRERD